MLVNLLPSLHLLKESERGAAYMFNTMSFAYEHI